MNERELIEWGVGLIELNVGVIGILMGKGLNGSNK